MGEKKPDGSKDEKRELCIIKTSLRAFVQGLNIDIMHRCVF